MKPISINLLDGKCSSYLNLASPTDAAIIAPDLLSVTIWYSLVSRDYECEPLGTLCKTSDFIMDWDWQDPVSKMYSEIFTNDIIIELSRKEEDVKEQLKMRITNQIAPGYKDCKKPDDGIGDLIIWYTIIEIGNQFKNDVVFVTNDTTKDGWFHNEYKTGVYPKAELFEEFFKETNGHSIKIIDFIKYFELYKIEIQNIVKVENTTSVSEQSMQIKGIASDILSSANSEDLKPELAPGMRIEHNIFGKGTIISIEEHVEDESKLVRIKFDSSTEMQFMLNLLDNLKYANSQP